MATKIIPDFVEGQTVHALPATGSARDAANMMCERHISAVLVIEDGRLIGIVTERDLTQRVLAAGKDPDATPLAEIMSRDPDTLSPEDSPLDALELMRVRGFRHLPVVHDGAAVAVVSIRDLYAAAKDQLEEDVRQREAFIFDIGYGGGA